MYRLKVTSTENNSSGNGLKKVPHCLHSTTERGQLLITQQSVVNKYKGQTSIIV